MKKIFIIGISGTGKSTLARKLSAKLNIPTFHLDTFIWKENWVEASQSKVEKNIKNVINKEIWIIEGFISPCATLKLEAADTIMYLDYAGWRAALGGLRRWWQNRGKVRPEMPAGCVEKLDWKYLKVMWKRMERQEIEDAIQGYKNKTKRFKSPRETKRFLKTISKI